MSNMLQQIMDRYRQFDLNQDGAPSINTLAFLDFEHGSPELLATQRLVVVLVESRLLPPLPQTEDILPRLERFKDDLRAEGFFSRFIAVDLYQGTRHQDGRTLLALRKFLRDIWTSFPQFLGAILVGSFPEATLVRRTIWRPTFNVTIAGVECKKTPYLAIEPEMVAARSEIVLADLNGKWDRLYHENTLPLESIRALPDAATAATDWPVDGAVFSSTTFERTEIQRFRDFFFINDGDYALLSQSQNELKIFIRRRQLHPELTASDRTLANPISRPDILISRINPRHVAVNPKTSIVGDNGVRPLDDQGRPQAFTSSQVFNTGTKAFFEADPVLERRLLCDYLDRNHRFRVGAFQDLPFRAGAIGAQGDPEERTLASRVEYITTASNTFEPPLVKEKATLLDYVQWLKSPAVLRMINAHSSPDGSGFHGQYAVVDLENESGGHPFRWVRHDTAYTPSFEQQGVAADLFLHRTLWQNSMLQDVGANLFVHGGCNANTPANTLSDTHYDEDYARWQNAEGVLFYLNGTALIARAKVFNDLPTGFPGSFALTSRARFGDGWRAQYENDAANSDLGTFRKAIDAKKAYFWSMLGDWSVRLRYRGGLGILGMSPQCAALHVHADQAWIEGWNFDTAVNSIRGVGDVDGDGRAECVVTSDWGIGLLKHDGHAWRAVVTAPNDTWFGNWRYNAAVNVGKDRHWGTANLTGNAKHEILLTSSWGIGVLSLIGATLHATIAQPNGTRFGGWLFDSRATKILGQADFDGDGRDEILVSSDWGVGLLKTSGNTFTSLALAKNGTRLGGWLLDTEANRFGPIGDFDGDGKAEILVSSPWGVGMLKLAGASLTSVLNTKNDTKLGSWKLATSTDQFGPVGDFDGDGKAECLIKGTTGLGVLKLANSALTSVAMANNGTRLDGWIVDAKHNTFGPVGDLDGDKREKAVLTSPWGIGFLELHGNTLRCPRLHANGSRLGDWILESGDRLTAVDNFSGTGTKHELLIQRRR